MVIQTGHTSRLTKSLEARTDHQPPLSDHDRLLRYGDLNFFQQMALGG